MRVSTVVPASNEGARKHVKVAVHMFLLSFKLSTMQELMQLMKLMNCELGGPFRAVCTLQLWCCFW